METLLILLLYLFLIVLGCLPCLLFWWLAGKLLPNTYSFPPLAMVSLCLTLTFITVALLKDKLEAGIFMVIPTVLELTLLWSLVVLPICVAFKHMKKTNLKMIVTWNLRLRKLSKWLSVLLLGWLLALSLSIWHFGTLDQAQPADCIIVLGAAVKDNQPSPVFAERIQHAVALYQQGFANKLIFTGGIGQGKLYSESSVARQFAQGLGIPIAAIYIEENSHTTQQNLAEATKLMQQHALKTAILVSDPLHMKRAMWMTQDQKLAAVSSPTPSSRYRSGSARLAFLGRELYFMHYYLFMGH